MRVNPSFLAVLNTKSIEVKHFRSKNERYTSLDAFATAYKLQKKAEEEEIRKQEEERLRLEEAKRKEQEEQKWKSKGFSHIKEYTIKISYYTDQNNKLEGGMYDRMGVLLASHGEPIVAMHSSIPYGSYLVTDEPVNGHTVFKIVDCGGAMKINGNVADADVFIAGKTSRWLELNTYKQTVKGKVYYKK